MEIENDTLENGTLGDLIRKWGQHWDINRRVLNAVGCLNRTDYERLCEIIGETPCSDEDIWANVQNWPASELARHLRVGRYYGILNATRRVLPFDVVQEGNIEDVVSSPCQFGDGLQEIYGGRQ